MFQFLLWIFDVCFWWVWAMRWFLEKFVYIAETLLIGDRRHYNDYDKNCYDSGSDDSDCEDFGSVRKRKKKRKKHNHDYSSDSDSSFFSD